VRSVPLMGFLDIGTNPPEYREMGTGLSTTIPCGRIHQRCFEKRRKGVGYLSIALLREDALARASSGGSQSFPCSRIPQGPTWSSGKTIGERITLKHFLRDELMS